MGSIKGRKSRVGWIGHQVFRRLRRRLCPEVMPELGSQALGWVTPNGGKFVRIRRFSRYFRDDALSGRWFMSLVCPSREIKQFAGAVVRSWTECWLFLLSNQVIRYIESGNKEVIHKYGTIENLILDRRTAGSQSSQSYEGSFIMVDCVAIQQTARGVISGHL